MLLSTPSRPSDPFRQPCADATPEDPDPGEAYTVSARFENVGTEAALDEVVLLKDGEVISRYRLDDLEPIDPSGEGNTASFSVGLTASLGASEFKLILIQTTTSLRPEKTTTRRPSPLRFAPYAVDLVARLKRRPWHWRNRTCRG